VRQDGSCHKFPGTCDQEWLWWWGQQQFLQLTDQSWGLISAQNIHSWLENWTLDLTNYPDINTESDLVLQVCKLHDTRKNVVPNLPHAFECCWETCKQTFTNPQAYFNHVETHVYCNPRGKKVKGGVPCHWSGEFQFPYHHYSTQFILVWCHCSACMAVALARITAVTCFYMLQQIWNLIVHIYIYLHSCRYLKAGNKVIMLGIITEKVIWWSWNSKEKDVAYT
jgi:hypothetical protein